MKGFHFVRVVSSDNGKPRHWWQTPKTKFQSTFEEQKLDEVVPLLLAKPTSKRLLKQVLVRNEWMANEVEMENILGVAQTLQQWEAIKLIFYLYKGNLINLLSTVCRQVRRGTSRRVDISTTCSMIPRFFSLCAALWSTHVGFCTTSLRENTTTPKTNMIMIENGTSTIGRCISCRKMGIIPPMNMVRVEPIHQHGSPPRPMLRLCFCHLSDVAL